MAALLPLDNLSTPPITCSFQMHNNRQSEQLKKKVLRALLIVQFLVSLTLACTCVYSQTVFNISTLCYCWLIWPIQNDAKPLKMTETLVYGYSSKSTQRELSNEYQHDRVWMVFKNVCTLVLRRNVASAMEGLSVSEMYIFCSCISNRKW